MDRPVVRRCPVLYSPLNEIKPVTFAEFTVTTHTRFVSAVRFDMSFVCVARSCATVVRRTVGTGPFDANRLTQRLGIRLI